MQFTEFTADSVRVYHTRIEHQGTPEFECGGLVPLSEVVVSEQDANIGIVMCPGCGGGGACVPLTGDTDAQRLHAHVRLADPEHPAQTLADAIESVLADVVQQRGVPSVDLGVEGLDAESAPDPATRPLLASLASRLEADRQAELERQLAAAEAVPTADEQRRTAAEALVRLDAILGSDAATTAEIRDAMREQASVMRALIPALVPRTSP